MANENYEDPWGFRRILSPNLDTYPPKWTESISMFMILRDCHHANDQMIAIFHPPFSTKCRNFRNFFEVSNETSR